VAEVFLRAGGLTLLGAILGSFLATLAIRWPQERTALAGRSACDSCGRTLTAIELVPLLSALLQRGRCRGCGAAIDPRHWRIEALAAAIGLASALVAPGWAGVAGAVFGWLLLTLAAIDAAELILPDELTATLAALGLASAALVPDPAFADRMIGAGAGFLSLWFLATFYGAARGREVMGEGDPRLLAAIGCWLGWQVLPIVLFAAAAVGLAAAAIARLRGGAIAWDSELPFGTFLAIAAYMTWVGMIVCAPCWPLP
jgi:leader peptidase (prepilin peptidase)/N-methyltransferase